MLTETSYPEDANPVMNGGRFRQRLDVMIENHKDQDSKTGPGFVESF
jgi:hypothetical protein